MVLVFFMDGVKYDMMHKNMPFLSSLNVRPMISEFGYSCACHATMYTGKYIDEHGTWFIWKKGNNSPYKWLNRVPFLKFINILPLKLIVGKLTNKFSRNSSYSGVPCLVNLPLKYWSMFEPCDSVLWNDPQWKKDIPNLFTILSKHEISHKVVALHKRTGPEDVFEESKMINFTDYDFVYYFIGYTDNIMHRYGEGGASQEYLARVDRFIEHECKKAKEIGKDFQVIAFSDHGHIDIEEPKIDINTYFTKKKVNDYIHLVESNFARFWFRNDDERIEIGKVMQRMTEENLGFVIDDDIKNKYHLNLEPKEHGELIFYLAPPKEFTNTIWGFGHSVVSGHGFEPIHSKHLGIFCTNKKIKETSDFAHLIDVLPTILASLNIPSQEGLKGIDLIERE